MAAFREHVTVSSVVGIGYAGTMGYFGFTDWTHSALAGVLCSVAGMLPDLDSDSGKPVREIFAFIAAVIPMMIARRLHHHGFEPAQIVLAMLALYALIRFGASWLLKQFTVHRGMFHSLPAAVIAAEIAFLAHHCPDVIGGIVIAGGVLTGFVSHLILDEVYSVDLRGLSIRLNKSAGSAFKLASSSAGATIVTWLMLGSLTYLVGIEQGYFDPIQVTFNAEALQTLR